VYQKQVSGTAIE